MPMPIRSGSDMSWTSARLRLSMRADMSLAAASAWRQPASTPLSRPNSAITPSPMNLSMWPPAASTACPVSATERATQRIGHEIRLQYRRVIADAGAIEGVGDARLEDVVREKKRNRESEHELGRLGKRHLERAAQPERPKRQAVMGREGAVEEDGAELRRPIFVDVLERAIHGLDRNEAQAVIDEMGRHVCQHDEARSQPQPPDHAVHPCSC